MSPQPTTDERRSEYLDSLLRHTTITPLWAKFWRCEPKWYQPARRLSDTMWYYFYQGRGECRLGDDDQRFCFGPGTLFMIPEGALHSVTPNKGVRVVAVTAHFHARLYGSVDVMSVLHMGGVYTGKSVLPWADGSKQLAAESLHHQPGWSWSMEAILRQLLVNLIRGNKISLTDTMPLRVLSALWPVFEFVEKNLADPKLRVCDLADCLNLSEVSLRKLFRRANLAAPAEYLRQQRIQRACMLLRTTQRPIQQIARQCGFDDIPLFYRQFRAHAAVTPKTFRERIEP
jgi:AraC-like DNA-binding protein